MSWASRVSLAIPTPWGIRDYTIGRGLMIRCDYFRLGWVGLRPVLDYGTAYDGTKFLVGDWLWFAFDLAWGSAADSE